MRGGTWLGRLCVLIAIAITLGRSAPARADQIADLTKMLASSSEKARVEAVLSLARLGDKRTLKPLVTALHDPSPQIRGIAATALGKLGHKAALPSLKQTATDDTDDAVRAKAHQAAIAVAKANHITDDLPAAPAGEPVQARHTPTGFGHSPHAVDDKPDLYVLIKGANDDSPGKSDKAMRKAHADFLKTTLESSLKTAPQVTMTATDAQRWGLDARHIDVSVVKLELGQSGQYMEMDAELRLAISDDTGRMLSFLSGGAKVQVLKSKFNPRYLPDLRKEALEGAMKGMLDKLLAHLRQTAQS